MANVRLVIRIGLCHELGTHQDTDVVPHLTFVSMSHSKIAYELAGNA